MSPTRIWSAKRLESGSISTCNVKAWSTGAGSAMAFSERHLGGHMRKQRGVTMIGWIFLLVPVALVLYAGIRVGPEYLNYYKVVTAMKETASALNSDDTLTPAAVRS